MTKYRHRNFPSDAAVSLAMGKATIDIYDSATDTTSTHHIFGEIGLYGMDAMDKKVSLSFR